jgi:hypothetical protein
MDARSATRKHGPSPSVYELGTNKMTKTLDERIEELCDQKGLRFKPWELPPWIVGDGPCPQNCSQSDRQYWAPRKNYAAN